MKAQTLAALFALLLLSASPASARPRPEGSHAASAGPQEPATPRVVSSTPLGPDLATGLESELAYRSGVLSLVSGDAAEAAEAFERSIALRPDRTGAHLFLAAALLRAGSVRAAGEIPLAFRSFLADFETQSRVTVNFALALAAGAALLLVGSLLPAIVRGVPAIAHEISEGLPPGVPRAIRHAYPLVLLAAPLYLLRPWVWSAGVAWTLLIYGILIRRSLGKERGVLIAGSLLLAAAAPALVFLSLIAAPQIPGSSAFALARSRDPFLRDFVRGEIETAAGRVEGDDALQFELARFRREEGNLVEAAEIYAALAESGTESSRARINLGNLLYTAGDQNGAQEQYRLALRSDPRSAAGHYNLAQTLSESFDYAEAKAHFRSASAINFDFVRGLSRATQDGKNFLLVDEIPTAADRWRWLFRSRETLPVLSLGEAARILASWLLPATPLGIAALLLLIAGAVAGGGLPLRSVPCVACGTPICRHCRVRVLRRNFCATCAEIAQRKAPFESIEAEKADRFRKAHARDRVLALVFGGVLPGAGHIYLGQVRLGRVVLFLTGILLFFLATHGGPLEPLPRLDAEVFGSLGPLALLTLAGVHIALVVHLLMLVRRRFA